MLKEQFFQILQEFSALTGVEMRPDEDTGVVSFVVDEEIIVNLTYLDESDMILIFCPVGGFGELSAADAGDKALALLRLTDLSGQCGHVTLALDESAGLVAAMDRRSALTIVTVDVLAAWVEFLVQAVHSVREYFAEHFPSQEE
jgi:hypothetical protein